MISTTPKIEIVYPIIIPVLEFGRGQRIFLANRPWPKLAAKTPLEIGQMSFWPIWLIGQQPKWPRSVCIIIKLNSDHKWNLIINEILPEKADIWRNYCICNACNEAVGRPNAILKKFPNKTKRIRTPLKTM